MIDQRVARAKLENLLRDPTGEIAELALKLDLLDAALHDEQFLLHRETKARLERIGFDVTKYAPPPRPSRAEQRSTRHVGRSDDIEAIILAAKEERPLDRMYRELLASLGEFAARRIERGSDLTEPG